MNKKLVVSVAFVVIVAVVIISFSTYYATLLETQKLAQDRFLASQQEPQQEFKNGSPILGSDSAPITIVEFGDYQCHQCHNWFVNTKPMIMRDYIETGKANLVFVDFAFLGRDSPKAAQATYCADDQNMYWEYHGALYTSQESKIDNGWANTERLKAFAFSLNLDMELFNECLDSDKYSKRVQYNLTSFKPLLRPKANL